MDTKKVKKPTVRKKPIVVTTGNYTNDVFCLTTKHTYVKLVVDIDAVMNCQTCSVANVEDVLSICGITHLTAMLRKIKQDTGGIRQFICDVNEEALNKLKSAKLVVNSFSYTSTNDSIRNLALLKIK